MKKIMSLVLATAVLATGMFAQVMKSTGLKNTLSTGFGRPYYAADADHSGMVNFNGFLDTFQVHYNVYNFTVESGLSWGMSYHNENDDYVQFGCQDYYVNFFAHPVEGLDIGAGTRLNWKVGKAPDAGTMWMPRPHTVQGGLGTGNPRSNSVVGKAFYANQYSSQDWENDAAIGIRYAYKDLFQLGLTIPNNVKSNSFNFNAALQVNPIDMLSMSVAYNGIGRSYGDLYVGSSLYFKNLSLDLYFAANFKPKSYGVINNKPTDNINNNLIGWGVASTISVPKFGMTFRPEVGFTDYMNPDYTFAWYIGNRFDVTFADAFNFGFWFSFANGAKNKSWGPDSATKNVDGGQIVSVSPDITWKINDRHSLSLAYNYFNVSYPNNAAKDGWNFDISWTYRR